MEPPSPQNDRDRDREGEREPLVSSPPGNPAAKGEEDDEGEIDVEKVDDSQATRGKSKKARTGRPFLFIYI